jgi:hypothetical protein
MHHVELDAHGEVAADPKQGHLSHSDHVQINAYFRALHLTPKEAMMILSDPDFWCK